MMIGLPASGKSSYIKHVLSEVKNHTVICPDDIQAELTGDSANQSMNRRVWQLAYERAQQALISGEVLVFDATNANQSERIQLIKFLRSVMGSDGHIQGIYLQTPLDICLARNVKRSRIVPEASMVRMNTQLLANPPKIEEGYNQLYVPAVPANIG